MECIYTIAQPPGTYLILTIRMFHLNYERHDRDYLEVRDGNWNESPLIGKFIENDIPDFIESTQNYLWMK